METECYLLSAVVLSAVMDDVEELVRTCCIRGYHVYKETWEATCGEVLVCERDIRNMEDRYAVAVKKDGTTVRHLPRSVEDMFPVYSTGRNYTVYCYGIAEVFRGFATGRT